MTLPDIMEKENAVDARQLKAMGCTLRACIKRAIKRRGFICGMTPCAELLHRDQGAVMMCILPNTTDNISAHIHQTLIQAFCRENNIPIIELDEDDGKLAVTIEKLRGKTGNLRMDGKAEDASCILLQYPKRGPGKHYEMLLQFYEEMMTKNYPMPQLSLPD